MGWMLMPPPHSYVGILTPNVMILGDEAFGKGLGHVGGVLMNGIYALTRETQTAPSPFSHVMMIQ